MEAPHRREFQEKNRHGYQHQSHKKNHQKIQQTGWFFEHVRKVGDDD